MNCLPDALRDELTALARQIWPFGAPPRLSVGHNYAWVWDTDEDLPLLNAGTSERLERGLRALAGAPFLDAATSAELEELRHRVQVARAQVAYFSERAREYQALANGSEARGDMPGYNWYAGIARGWQLAGGQLEMELVRDLITGELPPGSRVP